MSRFSTEILVLRTTEPKKVVSISVVVVVDPRLGQKVLDQFFSNFTKPIFLARIDTQKVVLKIVKIVNNEPKTQFFQNLCLYKK